MKGIFQHKTNLALINADSKETRSDQVTLPLEFNHPAMKTTADLLARYGNPVLNKKKFADKWIVLHTLPVQSSHLPAKIWMNRDVVPSFDSIMVELESKRLLEEIKSYDGCWVIRAQVGSTTISRHSWGIAFDLNAAWNPLHGKSTWSEDFVNVWRNKPGWIWGGDFHSRTDPMHFEFTAWDAF